MDAKGVTLRHAGFRRSWGREAPTISMRGAPGGCVHVTSDETKLPSTVVYLIFLPVAFSVIFRPWKDAGRKLALDVAMGRAATTTACVLCYTSSRRKLFLSPP